MNQDQQTESLPLLWILEDQEDHQFIISETLSSSFRLRFFGSIQELSQHGTDLPHPDLLVADLSLPDGNFISSWMNGAFHDLEAAEVPFVVVSALEDSLAISRALQMGARDYLLKPFSPKELIAKVRHSLIEHKLEKLALTEMESRIFRTLFMQSPASVDRQVLERRVWGDSQVKSKTLDVHLCRLRKKLTSLNKGIELETESSGWSIRTAF
jgi:DNA-binding response OmpR family regulator